MTAEVISLDSYDRQVSRRVKLAIFDSGKTQKAVAESAGLGPSSMTSRMNGTRPWRAVELMLIAQATGVEVTDLLPRLDSNQQPFGNPRDYRSIVRCGACGLTYGHRQDCPYFFAKPTARVVDLAAWREGRAS
jgi:transcriptional regulator with XRE-family HTH domain